MASLWTFVFLLGSLFVFGNACPTIVTRAGWGARAARGSTTLSTPVNTVVIHHTVTPFCNTQADCAARVRSMQNFHMDTNGWVDIGYNFIVGESGHIFEGRGWTRVGAHAANWNSRSIGIAVIGDFTNRAPNAAAQNAVRNLITCGMNLNRITRNHQLTGHRNVGATACPGNAFFNVIRNWPNFTASPRSATGEPLTYMPREDESIFDDSV